MQISMPARLLQLILEILPSYRNQGMYGPTGWQCSMPARDSERRTGVHKQRRAPVRQDHNTGPSLRLSVSLSVSLCLSHSRTPAAALADKSTAEGALSARVTLLSLLSDKSCRLELSEGHAASWRETWAEGALATRATDQAAVRYPAQQHLSGVPTTLHSTPVRPATSHGAVSTAVLPDKSRAGGGARWGACTGSDAGQLGGSGGAVGTAGCPATCGS